MPMNRARFPGAGSHHFAKSRLTRSPLEERRGLLAHPVTGASHRHAQTVVAIRVQALESEPFRTGRGSSRSAWPLANRAEPSPGSLTSLTGRLSWVSHVEPTRSAERSATVGGEMGLASTPGFSLGLVCGVAIAAWISGALFGWSWRETRTFAAGLVTVRRKVRAGGVGDRKAPRSPTRVRGSGYYVSEETLSWGRRRWRRVLGWVFLTLIVSGLTGAVAVAALAYRATPPTVVSTDQP